MTKPRNFWGCYLMAGAIFLTCLGILQAGSEGAWGAVTLLIFFLPPMCGLFGWFWRKDDGY